MNCMGGYIDRLYKEIQARDRSAKQTADAHAPERAPKDPVQGNARQCVGAPASTRKCK